MQLRGNETSYAPISHAIPKIDNFYFRQRATFYSLSQVEFDKFLSGSIIMRLNRRRRRPQQCDTVIELRPNHRKIPGMIPQVIFLFIGCIVLFIYDNQADLGKRCKHSRSGTDSDIGLLLQIDHSVHRPKDRCAKPQYAVQTGHGIVFPFE